MFFVSVPPVFFHLNTITTYYFLSIPYILSLVDLLTRRPVDFFKLGVNRFLMDLIGCKIPHQRCKISHQLPKKCDFCYDVEYLRKSWA